MTFQYIVGRFYPKKKKKLFLKATFAELDDSKRYAEARDLDLCPNSILFIYDEKNKNTVFLSSVGKNWRTFDKAAYYNCSKDDDIMLEEVMWYQDFKTALEAAVQNNLEETGKC